MGSKRIRAVTVPKSADQLGYLAGLIDGEGSIAISSAFCRRKSTHVSHNCRLIITNCDPRLMQWLLGNVGGSLRTKQRTSASHRTAYDWRLYDINAEAVLRAVRPYLVLKGEQADIALAFFALRRNASYGVPLTPAAVQEKESLRLKLAVLNTRGLAAVAG